jgi:hypothetical protein
MGMLTHLTLTMKVRGSFIQESSRAIPKNAIMEINPSGSFQITYGRRNNIHSSNIIHTNSSVALMQRRKNEVRLSMIGGTRLNKRGRGSRALNFMTASERLYSSGGQLKSASFSFDDGGSRLVGALTEAQNVGSLF